MCPLCRGSTVYIYSAYLFPLSRKIALLWEVVQVRRNAELYNEERSLIISHARILVRTLCKFITSTTSDPLVHYREAEEEDEEGERAVEEGELLCV